MRFSRNMFRYLQLPLNLSIVLHLKYLCFQSFVTLDGCENTLYILHFLRSYMFIYYKMNIRICRSILVAWFWCLSSRFVFRTQNSDLSDNGLFSNKHHLVLNIKVHYTVTNPQTAMLHCARASHSLLTTSTRTVIFPTVQTKTLFQ